MLIKHWLFQANNNWAIEYFVLLLAITYSHWQSWLRSLVSYTFIRNNSFFYCSFFVVVSCVARFSLYWLMTKSKVPTATEVSSVTFAVHAMGSLTSIITWSVCIYLFFFFFYWAMNLVLWTSEFISYINVSFICPLLQRMLDAHSAFGNYQWTTIFFFPSSLHFRCILPFISITLWWYIFNIEFVGLAPLYSLKYFESLIRFIKITVASITRAVSRWWHKSRLMDLWKIPRTFRSNVISRGIFMLNG